MASAPATAMSNMTLLENNVDTVWSMAFNQLERGSSEILLPAKVADNLGELGVRVIGERYSAFLSAQCTVMVDQVSNTVRLQPPTGYEEPANSAHLPAMEPEPVATVAFQGPIGSTFMNSPSANVYKNMPTSNKIGRNKKAKIAKARVDGVPRPANAFIVYRQEWHRKIKAEDPTIQNKEISKIVGKKWHQEPESTRAEYRGRAQAIKEKHESDHPGYQYRPRKAGEKKARLSTKNKLQLRVPVPKLNDSDMVPQFEVNDDGTLGYKFEPGQTGLMSQQIEQFNADVGGDMIPWYGREQIAITDSEESVLDAEYADLITNHGPLAAKMADEEHKDETLRHAYAAQNPPQIPPDSFQGWFQYMCDDLGRFAGVHNNTLAPEGTLEVGPFFNDATVTRYDETPLDNLLNDGQPTTVAPLSITEFSDKLPTNNMFELEQLRSVFPEKSDPELIDMMGMDDNNVSHENTFIDDNVDWYEWLNTELE